MRLYVPITVGGVLICDIFHCFLSETPGRFPPSFFHMVHTDFLTLSLHVSLPRQGRAPESFTFRRVRPLYTMKVKWECPCSPARSGTCRLASGLALLQPVPETSRGGNFLPLERLPCLRLVSRRLPPRPSQPVPGQWLFVPACTFKLNHVCLSLFATPFVMCNK